MSRHISKKTDVLDAALALFMKKGIKATTTRDIALRAGISEGTIYRHFESKDELAEILFEDNLLYFSSFLKGYLKSTSKPADMLQAFIEGFFEFSRREQRRYGFIVASHQTELKKLSRERMKPKEILAKIIRLGQKQGVFRSIDIKLSASMIMGIVMQTIFYLKSGRIAVNYDDVVAEVVGSGFRILNIEDKSSNQTHSKEVKT